MWCYYCYTETRRQDWVGEQRRKLKLAARKAAGYPLVLPFVAATLTDSSSEYRHGSEGAPTDIYYPPDPNQMA